MSIFQSGLKTHLRDHGNRFVYPKGIQEPIFEYFLLASFLARKKGYRTREYVP